MLSNTLDVMLKTCVRFYVYKLAHNSIRIMISTIYARSRVGALYVRAIIKQEEKHCLHLRFVGHWIYELYLIV